MQKDTDTKASSWGGARSGAGRKKTTARSIALRAPPAAAAIHAVPGSKTAFIVAAIRAYAASGKD